MKYLKLFEDIKSDGYEEIRDREYDSLMLNYYGNNNFFIPYTANEVSFLTRIGFIEYPNPNYRQEGVNTQYMTKETKAYDHRTEIKIYKAPDEWFYLKVCSSRFRNRVYKCDQFDGVKACLNNLKELGYIKIKDE